jgi:hypothetical protein
MKMLDSLPDDMVVEVKLTLYASGALKVEGPMDDKPFMLAMIDHARDAIKNHGLPQKSNLIIPPKDVSLG